MREKWQFDGQQANCNVLAALLYNGNFFAVDLWMEKSLQFWKEADLPTSRDYSNTGFEMGWGLLSASSPLLVYIGGSRELEMSADHRMSIT